MNLTSAAAISNLQHAIIQQEISTSVAVKANDVAKAQGEMVLELLGAAADGTTNANATPHRIDVLA